MATSSGAENPVRDSSDNDRRLQQRVDRLQSLRKRMIEVEEDNKKDLFREHSDKILNRPEPLGQLRRRLDAEKAHAKLESDRNGQDLDRSQNLNYTAEDVERWNEKLKRLEKRKDRGFTDWNAANLRKHKKLISKLKPDLKQYDSEGFSLYRSANSVEYVHAGDEKPLPVAIDRMVKDLESQQAVRKLQSRYRHEDSQSDVSYISDKNRQFNKKLSRAYDKFTDDIKASFERGTAL